MLISTTAFSQCPEVFDFYGLPSDNPYWFSCSGNAYTLNLQSPDNWGEYDIDWGDGSANSSGPSWSSPSVINHIYAASVDTFIVVITEISSGCVVQGVLVSEEATSASIQIPIGGLTQACAPQEMEFINSSTNVSETTTFTWDFGDGSAPEVYDYTNLGQVVSHTYEPNTVDCETEVSLLAENYCNAIQGGASEATFNPIRIWDVDDAAITASATVLCFPDNTVTFSNTTERNCLFQGNIAQRYEYWNFGDYWGEGQDSIIDWTPWPPTFPHTLDYPGLGSYEVMMLDSNFCGIDTAIITITIVPPPTAGLNVSDDIVCEGEPITFFQGSSGGGDTYKWNFGDGVGWLPTGAGNITYVYNNPGTYFVQTAVSVASSGGSCADTTGVNVTVLPSPNAVISADNFDGCDQITVNFGDNSTDAVSWEWDFGNGEVYSGNTPPPQIYDTPGSYVVDLVVENSEGCPDLDQEVIEIYESPVVNFIADNVCQGSVSQFTDLSSFDPGDPIISWSWNFGDGGTSDLPDPTHVFNGTGVFFITLDVETPQCSGSITLPITVEPAPVPAFTLDPESGCSPLQVSFTNNTAGASSFTWDFGDGFASPAENPEHTFINLGTTDTTYTVVLTAYTAFGCGKSDSLDVTVLPGAIAGFTDNSNPPGCSPFDAVFNNTSQGASSYHWDFGDNSTSVAVNPSHQYVNNTGLLQTYTVELIAFAANGCNDTITSNIIVYPLADFDFTIVPDSGCSPLTIQFPFIPGAQLYNWDFGNGDGSNVGTPTYTYFNDTTEPIVYDVELIGISAFGCVDTAYSSVQVNPSPIAQFTADVLEGCSPLDITLTNESIQADVFNWDYGNNESSTTSNAVHQITLVNDGNQIEYFDINLVAATNDGCQDDFTITVQVFPEVTASFADPGPQCSPSTLQLDNTSENASNFVWDLGNGIVSLDNFPTTTYVNPLQQDSLFVIELSATSIYGCSDDYSGTILLQPSPQAGFIASSTIGCQPLPVDLTNTSTDAASYLWIYGDNATSATDEIEHTHEYISLSNQPLVYELQLIAYSAAGCTDTVMQPITVYPSVVASFTNTAQGCSPLQASFISQSAGATESLTWDFGDETGATGSVVNHTYINNSDFDETFTVSLIAQNVYGCTDTAYADITVLSTPIADIEIASQEGCYPLDVTFTNNTTGADTFQWFYGTGEVSTTSEPEHTHTYFNTSTSPVNYTVTMVASSDGCSSSDQVQVSVYPQLVAEFDAPDQACSPLTIDFDNLSIGAATYAWDFGDNNTHTIFEPVHTYTNTTGDDLTYIITLTAISPFGCEDTWEHEVTVFSTPNAAFTASPLSQIYPNTTIDLVNNSSGGSSIIYTWDMDDNNELGGIDPGSYTYNTWGTYNIELFITNGSCSDETTQTIEILAPDPVANFVFEAEGCAPLNVNFTNQSLFGQNFFWDFGDGGSANVSSPNYTYYQSGTFTVTLIVTGFNGLQDIYQAEIEVNPQALAAFTVTPDEVSIPSQPIQTINLSQNATSYEWDFGDGVTSNLFQPEHYYTEEGFYTVSLTATNEFGCPNTFTVVDAVYAGLDGLITFPNAFTPNDLGPSGGQFNPEQLDNDIFFPMQKGVAEYNLQIFNRWGELLFQSLDVGIGWDGYYKGELCKQDVYIWKVRARFSDGEEVEKAGDVTLLR